MAVKFKRVPFFVEPISADTFNCRDCGNSATQFDPIESARQSWGRVGICCAPEFHAGYSVGEFEIEPTVRHSTVYYRVKLRGDIVAFWDKLKGARGAIGRWTDARTYCADNASDPIAEIAQRTLGDPAGGAGARREDVHPDLRHRWMLQVPKLRVNRFFQALHDAGYFVGVDESPYDAGFCPIYTPSDITRYNLDFAATGELAVTVFRYNAGRYQFAIGSLGNTAYYSIGREPTAQPVGLMASVRASAEMTAGANALNRLTGR